MSKVTRVTFSFEGSDPEDGTGMTPDEFDRVHEGISWIGGYDMEMEVVDEPDPVERGRKT